MCWTDARLGINEGTVCRSSAWGFAEMFADGFLPAEAECEEEKSCPADDWEVTDAQASACPCFVCLNPGSVFLPRMHVSGWQCPWRACLRLARTLQLATLFFMLLALLLPWRLGYSGAEVSKEVSAMSAVWSRAHVVRGL
jgi:hypothetical protein